MTTDKALGAMAMASDVAASGSRRNLTAWLLRAIGGLLAVWLLIAGVLVAWRTLQIAAQPVRLAPLGLSAAMLVAAAWFMCAWRRGWRHDRRFWRRVSPSSSAPRVLQQFTRSRSADGEETIEGSVAVSVDRGSKTGAAHIGFCPPFASRPQFDLRTKNGRDVVLKVGQLLPQGVRIEAKLSAPAEAARIVSVQFVARSRSDSHGPMAV